MSSHEEIPRPAARPSLQFLDGDGSYTSNLGQTGSVTVKRRADSEKAPDSDGNEVWVKVGFVLGYFENLVGRGTH